MKSRFIFKVEKKVGSLPDISYKCVFERELLFISDSAHPSIEQVFSVLSFLFPDHRVLVTSDEINLPFNS